MKFRLVENIDDGFKNEPINLNENDLYENFFDDEIDTVEKALETYKLNYRPRGYIDLEDISRRLKSDTSFNSSKFRSMSARDINDILNLYLKIPTKFTRNKLKVKF